VFEQVSGGSEVILKPGLNIIGGVHPFGLKGPIACMLDVGFADDIDGMPELDSIFDAEDDSDAILDMDSTGALGFVVFEALLSGMAPVVGPFIDVGGMEVIEFADSGLLLSGLKTAEGWLSDMDGIEDSDFADSTTLLSGIEFILVSCVDILAINSFRLDDLRIIVPVEKCFVG